MKCKECGYELNENWNVCPICSQKINNKKEFINSEQNKKSNISENNKSSIINLSQDKIYILLFLFGIILCLCIKNLSIVGFLISLISIVTGYMKFPNNKIIKIFFWIFLSAVILYIVFIIFLAYTCFRNYRFTWR